GELASNADLVTRAVKILENMNVNVIAPQDVRKKLKLTKHS
ncbi:MAG: 3-keto-5-aminohexanoate cleavage protein, partial [Actinobacteria bacterium]|nr:3-keto-5-aminohexanoate cleavage protein [Actinomycetota bacterium]